MGKRVFLAGLGLGMLVIYVGQQTVGASPCAANDTTAVRGRADALDAIAKATAEGFRTSTWIYLDIEKNPGGSVTAGMLAYVRGWVDQVLLDGTYNPGIYCHQSEIPAIDPVVTSAFQAAGRANRARYWCVGGPVATALTDPPTRCGVPEAIAWQQRIDFAQTFAGHTLTIDRSVSSFLDPSAP